MIQQHGAFQREVTRVLACRYLLHLPAGYGQTDRRWPLMLFLHGVGQRGSDLEAVKKHGPPGLVERQDGFPFVLVSPQCPIDRWWENNVLTALLDELGSRYAVDPDRVYLTGLSMGGFGTWSLAIECPQRFAAIAPVCGGGLPALAYRLRHVPIWAFHGAKDPVVPLYESQRMVEAVQRAGGNARLTIYPDAEHDAWTETYNNPELYAWLLSHRRFPGEE